MKWSKRLAQGAKIRCAQPVAATVPTGQGAKSAAEIQRSYWSIPSVKLSRQGCLGSNGDCVFGPAELKTPVESCGWGPQVGLAGQSPLIRDMLISAPMG
jgi:hypothetical protein